MEHGQEGDVRVGPESERTASLLGEIAGILRVDPTVFFHPELQVHLGRDLPAEDLAALLELFRSIDKPDLRAAALDLIRALQDRDRTGE